ncbi:hypothetical protein [Acidihalobacter aeolianus]|nr:hypothetical protein [Acidihalobacter aeolianus]
MSKSNRTQKERFLFQLAVIQKGLATAATVERIRDLFAQRFWHLSDEAERALDHASLMGGEPYDAQVIWASAVESVGRLRQNQARRHAS